MLINIEKLFSKENLNNNYTIMKKSLISIIIALIVIIFASSSFGIISSGEVGILYHYGSITNTFGEGIYFKLPIIDKVLVVDVKTKKIELDASASSKDLQTVESKIALNYNIDKSKIIKLYRDIGPDFSSRIIEPSMQESIKSATAKFTAEELITKRDKVKEFIIFGIKEKLSLAGILVSDINIVNFEFSKSFNDSIELKVKAEQDALAEKNKLEQVKYEAQQTIEQAKAQAESIKIQAQSISAQGGAEYVKLKWIEKWNGALPTTTLGTDTNTLVNLK